MMTDLTHITVSARAYGSTGGEPQYPCPDCAADVVSQDTAGTHIYFDFAAPALAAAVSDEGWTSELWAAELRVRLTLFQLIYRLRSYPPPLALCDSYVDYAPECGLYETAGAAIIVPVAERDAWATKIKEEMAEVSWSPLD